MKGLKRKGIYIYFLIILLPPHVTCMLLRIEFRVVKFLVLAQSQSLDTKKL